MAGMQEVRSQLEIQLQKRNSEVQAYHEPKEAFPARNLRSCCSSLLRNEAVAVACYYCWRNSDNGLNTAEYEAHMRSQSDLATGCFSCNLLEWKGCQNCTERSLWQNETEITALQCYVPARMPGRLAVGFLPGISSELWMYIIFGAALGAYLLALAVSSFQILQLW